MKNSKYSLTIATLSLLFAVQANAAGESKAKASAKGAAVAAPAEAAPAAAASPYGQVYAAYEQDPYRFEFSFGYRAGQSNPYFYTHGLGVGTKIYFKQARYFVGVDSTFYTAGLNSYSEEVKQVLIDQGLESAVAEPRNHTVVSVGVVPLAGLLNFFSTAVIPFDVQLSTGVGRFAYQGESARTTINVNLDYVMQVYDPIAISTGLNFFFEKAREPGWQGRIEAGVKVIGRF